MVYVNLAQALAQMGTARRSASASASTDANLAALSAIGLTAHEGSDGTATFHLNVVTR